MRVVPNPFNPSTTIHFELPEGGHVELAIYDAAGRYVRTLVTRRLRAGPHAVQWDGRDQIGQQAASGVYFARLRAGDENQSRKLVMLK
jgi:flagellar hook assembly protein FlgD